MLRSGDDYLKSLKDGRVVYVGKERIDDVTTHPAFRNAARTVASIYDMKRAPERREEMSFEANGDRHSIYYLRARNREDLAARTNAHRVIADATYGLFGRSPDYVASLVTGMSAKPEVFGPTKDNLLAHYRYMRDHDIFAAHAVIPPQSARDPAFYQQANRPAPSCRVVREEDDGVVVSGMKLLATGAIIGDEIWIGNILPLSLEAKAESITFPLPCNAPGLSLWSRKPLEPTAPTEFDYPLTWRFDETDAMLVMNEVKVPWEKVIVHNDPKLSRELYITTPAHAYANHQTNVRFWSKLRLIVGLASKVTQATGAIQIQTVKDTLGLLASQEAMIGGMVLGQIQAPDSWGEYCSINRRYMYGAMNWCADNYPTIIQTLRELCGGGAYQMPADTSVFEDPEMAKTFTELWHTPQLDALPRFKLFRLAWDIVGSEFAGRHLLYERFFGGATFIQRANSFREADWKQFDAIVEELMNSYSCAAERDQAAAQ